MSLNGKPLLDFDVTQSSRAWASTGGRAELHFEMREKLHQDAYGVMYLTVPAEMLTDGEPATITVVGAKANTGRWFAVADERNTLDR